MIINSGMRTDIPAYYSKWFMNRIRDGYVFVRNPYFENQVTRYRLDPEVVDVLAFCSKNPKPMLGYLSELKRFHMFWFVTITPYDEDIEPNVPPKEDVMDSFKVISDTLGVNSVSWRYDPIFINDKYSVEYHIKAFEDMASYLKGYTNQVVISFVDLYAKTIKNFPEVREVNAEERIQIGKAFAEIGKRHGMVVRSCVEGTDLATYGIDISGCMTKEVLERAVGSEFVFPKTRNPRQDCNCVLGHDIGAYNTCGHMCKYCYANYDEEIVRQNMKKHDSDSPFLIGQSMPGDEIHEAKQMRYATGQMMLNI